ncbi:hypothetical protein HY388_01545 [Candidatus Daviesbacteria bacterium]|nr:hypothetical protein [Candidatus Daviesbacteria bacterium]
MKGKAKSVKGKVNFSSFTCPAKPWRSGVIHHSSLVVLLLTAYCLLLTAPASALQLPGGNTIQTPNNFNPQINNIGDLVGIFLQYALLLGGIMALVFLVVGGFRYVISASDAKGAESARNQITMALVGLFVIFIAYWLTKLVETILGAKVL